MHFAAVNGHVRCIRLVVADFIPSVPYDIIASKQNGERGDTSVKQKYDHAYVLIFCANLYVEVVFGVENRMVVVYSSYTEWERKTIVFNV